MNMATENKIELKCLIHGDYIKFISDENKQCPHCEQEKEQKKQVKEVADKKLDAMSVIIEVKIPCDEHGVTTLQIPKFLMGKANRCPVCVEEKRQRKILKKANGLIEAEIIKTGIPVNNIGLSFQALDATRSPKQQKIVARLIQYIKDMVAAGESDGAKNVLLTGNMGTGKTAYASVLLQGIIRRGVDTNVNDANDLKLKGGLTALFISEPSLQNEITATWGSNATEKTKDLIHRYATKSILCIDDVGSVTTTHTHLLDAYAAIIDERYKRNLPTIMTSNLAHEDLRLAIGARSADRFMEKNRIIIANFDWKGYRGGDMGTDEVEFF